MTFSKLPLGPPQPNQGRNIHRAIGDRRTPRPGLAGIRSEYAQASQTFHVEPFAKQRATDAKGAREQPTARMVLNCPGASVGQYHGDHLAHGPPATHPVRQMPSRLNERRHLLLDRPRRRIPRAGAQNLGQRILPK